jgi:hypothetical protein
MYCKADSYSIPLGELTQEVRTVTELGRRIWRYLGEDAPPLLQTYYSTYTGRAFETLGRGGDLKAVANRITPDDIVAVSMLGVNIPPQVSLELLNDANKEVNGFLKEIPVKKDLWQVEESDIDNKSNAAQLWKHLDGIVGVGWVTAGKLMARKRPQLIPVFDRVVRQAIKPRGSNTFWVSLHRELKAEDPGIVGRLRELKNEAALPRKVSLLRVLDVAVWMGAPRD